MIDNDNGRSMIYIKSVPSGLSIRIQRFSHDIDWVIKQVQKGYFILTTTTTTT